MKRLAVLVPLVMFLAFAALALYRLAVPADTAVASRMVGQPVPPFELAGLGDDRQGLQTADLSGGKPSLVNVFASWCVPCRVEAPQLAALAKAGITIHAIAVRDRPPDIAAFLRDHGDPFARIGLDPDSRAMVALGASGVPETYLVDGEGIIRRQYIGEIRADQVAEIIRDVEALR